MCTCNFALHNTPAEFEHVYLIQCGAFVKIGVTTQPAKRLSQLQTANPYRMKPLLLLLGDSGDERDLHLMFRRLHHRGEWFRYEGDLVQFVESDENRGNFWDLREAA